MHLPDFALFLPFFVCCSVGWQELLEVMHQLRVTLQQLSHLQQHLPVCEYTLHIAGDCMSSDLATRHRYDCTSLFESASSISGSCFPSVMYVLSAYIA